MSEDRQVQATLAVFTRCVDIEIQSVRELMRLRKQQQNGQQDRPPENRGGYQMSVIVRSH